MPWEHQHQNLHNLSLQWLSDRKVLGTGRFVMNENGLISPA
ncbi:MULTISPECIES: hypothetical protein [unclassified Streptomyces]|nr:MULTISPECIES: hypothetical protein [unclassified Streptomyces]MCX5052546.1 hypothetical protein [Streptomyces sp. NBC_00474]MCX5063555.1 hypothetical protein [Streptomyces sp. NBC_00452]MCX5294367.1 hypothetical protein [Streptomyces sp. NBC_00183]